MTSNSKPKNGPKKVSMRQTVIEDVRAGRKSIEQGAKRLRMGLPRFKVLLE